MKRSVERTRLCEAGGPTFSMEVASPRTTRCRYRKRTKLGHNETCGSITGGSDTGFDPVVVLAERKKKFDRDGCVVLDDFFTEDQVGLLRRECDAILRRASGLTEEEDAASGVNVGESGCVFEVLQDAARGAGAPVDAEGLREARSQGHLSAEVCGLLLGSALVDLARGLLGCDEVYYFNEQYIVKPGMCVTSAFAWHRDSDWCWGGEGYHPYVSLWTALDDVNEENGTLYTRGPGAEEKPIIANAGSVVVMGDRTLHRSCVNLSDKGRRVWMPQFSSGPITAEGGEPVSFAVKLS